MIMNSDEMESYLSSRGATLCLGLNSHVTPLLLLKILGLDGQIHVTEDRILLLFNNYAETFEKQVYVNGEKWKVVCNVRTDMLRSAIMMLPLEIFYTAISKTGSSDKLEIEKWNINNVWLLDTFPYQTRLGTQALTWIRDWCKVRGYGLGVGLIKGYNQYGSTDISSEGDAIDREMEHLKREHIPAIIVDRHLSMTQAFEIQTLSDDRLQQKMDKLEEEKLHTLDNLEFGKDLLAYFIADKVGAGVSEARKSVQKILTSKENLADLFPIGKYLDDRFYAAYESAITPYFRDNKDSEKYKVNEQCAEALDRALRCWMRKNIT